MNWEEIGMNAPAKTANYFKCRVTFYKYQGEMTSLNN